jgi:radical SAM protein with 4Fe4S-binding SPASM domain
LKPSTKLQLAAHRGNIPLTVIFELTRRCNLNCRHCYIPSSERKLKDISFGGIKKILRSTARAGAMYAVFTGGELFLRDDIFDIIGCAKKLAFDVRLFTNGVLVDSSTASKVSAAGVSAVEISIYGDEAAHDYITRRRGSFLAATKAVDEFLRSGVRVTVKAPLMKSNYSCLEFVQKFAASRAISCRFDATIAPCDDGSASGLGLRLSDGELRKVYRRLGAGVPSEYCGPRARSYGARGERLVECSAARAMAAVSSDGELYPCPQMRISAGNLLKTDFASLWRGKVFEGLRRARLGKKSACFSCAHLAYCQRCPGLALVEHGSLLTPPAEACRLSAVRRFVAENV